MGMVVLEASLSDYYQNKIANDCVRLGIPYLLPVSYTHLMHAPLTGVFLIAELTGGYDLFLPLMIVSVSSYLTIIMFEPHSIYSCLLYTSRCV